MKIWHKILAAPGVAVVFLVLLGAVSYAMLARQHDTLGEMYKHRFGNYQLAANSAQAISEVHSNVYRLFTWIANLKEDKIKQITDEQKGRIDEVTKKITQFAADSDQGGEERKLAETIVKKLGKYKKDVDTAIDMSTVEISTGMVAMQTADSGFQSLLKDINQLVQIETRLAQASYEEADSAFAKVVVALMAILVLALGISVGISAFMSRMIVRPLKAAIALAGRIARGDLTSEIKVVGRDETAELLRALSDMNASLVKIVGEVRSGTDSIATASKQIASGNADLSSRTEEQASSLEETASSMEELTSTVKQNAENAKQANQLAASASEVALKGGAVVSQVVGTMSSINDSSKKIVDIISVIDGIAFQTNILALNAAVEAARAGEQGRGFAVVASEVRSLAQRSAAAAKEIKALIGDSVDKVGAGTKLVDEAGKTMQEIVASVKRVTDIMSEIMAASQEQSSGIEQVNQAITQMDQVTQQNSALVEEAAAAAESMQEQAGNLAQAVAVFELDGTAAGAAAGRRAQAAENDEPQQQPATERRGPNRAPNVARLPAKPAQAQTAAKKAVAGGGEDQWEEF